MQWVHGTKRNAGGDVGRVVRRERDVGWNLRRGVRRGVDVWWNVGRDVGRDVRRETWELQIYNVWGIF